MLFILRNSVRLKYHFRKCIGIIDGTLFPFTFKPGLTGEDYFCRKSIYALHSLITCDDVGRIRDIVLGWPGSVHDNRVWRNSRLNDKRFFCLGQYLLGDSAFEASEIMVSSYKKPATSSLPQQQEFFNTILAKIRIRSKHSIGMLKGRFQFMKGMRMRIRKESDLMRTVELIRACTVIHNWLIEEPDSVLKSSFTPQGRVTKYDPEATEDDEAFVAYLENNTHAGALREEIKHLILDNCGFICGKNRIEISIKNNIVIQILF